MAHVNRLRPFDGEVPTVWRKELERVRRNGITACDVVGNGNDSRNHGNTPAAAVNESHVDSPQPLSAGTTQIYR
jgi:hypothetical protein